MSDLHPNLPKLPHKIKSLPVDERGFPVPWFVAWIDGKPDFRVIDPAKIVLAVQQTRCWVCGDKLKETMSFVAGPMCAVTRTSGEPPSHSACATFSATACPFLTKPAVVRREENLPAGTQMNENHLSRNPGVAMIWVTKNYKVIRAGSGVVFKMGDPLDLKFFCSGRKATREEVMHSIDTGMPFLRGAVTSFNEMDELEEMYKQVVKLIR